MLFYHHCGALCHEVQLIKMCLQRLFDATVSRIFAWELEGSVFDPHSLQFLFQIISIFFLPSVFVNYDTLFYIFK